MSCLKQFRDFLRQIEKETQGDVRIYLDSASGEIIIRVQWHSSTKDYGLEQLINLMTRKSDQEIISNLIQKFILIRHKK